MSAGLTDSDSMFSVRKAPRPARLRTDPRRPARSSSRLRELGRARRACDPRRACRDRPIEAPAYSRTMDGQGAGPGGRFPTRSFCNGYPN